MILERFKRGGLVSVMATPPKSMKPGSSQANQLPRMRSQSQITEESSPELEEAVHSAPDYIVPRVEGAPEVNIPKSGKFPIPIPPIDSRVKENEYLLGYADVVKFIDYNLGDSKTYPQFRLDQYLTIENNPRTGRDEYVPMAHVQILEHSGLLNLLRLPHFG